MYKSRSNTGKSEHKGLAQSMTSHHDYYSAFEVSWEFPEIFWDDVDVISILGIDIVSILCRE